MDRTQEAQFEQTLMNAVEEAKLLGYHPNRFVGAIHRKGAFQTVKDIVASGQPSEGFDKLAVHHRIDLSCEAIIVETRWRAFFDADLLDIAERRLTTYKYKWRRFEPADAALAPPVSSEIERADSPAPPDDEFQPPDDDQRERALRMTHERPTQAAFRDRLLREYGARCCLSGVTVEAALEAAHITAYRGEPSNHVQNGLLLRADLHKLFDRLLLSIDPTSLTIKLSNVLRESDAYRAFDGATLDFGQSRNRPSHRALTVHWNAFHQPDAP